MTLLTTLRPAAVGSSSRIKTKIAGTFGQDEVYVKIAGTYTQKTMKVKVGGVFI